MTPEAYLAFLAACVVLMLFPGPSVLMTIGHGLTHGFRRALAGIAGTMVGFVLQVGLALFGLASFLALVAHLFEWLRWAGVLYLAFLGIRALASRGELELPPTSPRGGALLTQGLLVAITNPKTLLFFAAFFPQFLRPGMPLSTYVLLGGTVIATAFLSVLLYALFAGRVRVLFARPGARRTLARVSGGFFLGGAVVLALARRPA